MPEENVIPNAPPNEEAGSVKANSAVARASAELEVEMKKRLRDMLTEQRAEAPFAGIGAAISAPELSNIDASNPNAITATAVDATVEEIAKAAYAKVAEELKWKGDFPEWEKITDRARQLYVEGVDHVQQGKASVLAAKEHIERETEFFQQNCKRLLDGALDAAKPRTRFEEIVVEVLNK